MKSLVDTSIWSLALRRSGTAEQPAIHELRSLIADRRVTIIGPIRQEVLSGIRQEAQFAKLQARLAAFPDLALETDDFVMAAKYFNQCRSIGIQGSNTDFLICAVAVRRECSIFTADKDFANFARCLPIVLHQSL
jgi:predicted nucleic acid-binding protein